MTYFLRLFTVTLTICVLLHSLVATYRSFIEQQVHYRSEGICIALHIANGVERSNIITDSGSCYIKVDTYAQTY